MLVFFSALVMAGPSTASPGLPISVSTRVLSQRVSWDIPRPCLHLSSLYPSIPLEGKKQVWKNQVIPILVTLLSDMDEEVKANAAGALMHATVTTEGEARVPCGFLRLGGCRQEGQESSPSLLAATVSFPNVSSSCQGPSSDLSGLKAPSKSTFDLSSKSFRGLVQIPVLTHFPGHSGLLATSHKPLTLGPLPLNIKPFLWPKDVASDSGLL